MTRRELLQVGGAGLFGLSLSKVWAAEAAQPVFKARAKDAIRSNALTVACALFSSFSIDTSGSFTNG